MRVQLILTVIECQPQSAAFAVDSYKYEYEVGYDGFDRGIPTFNTEPKCTDFEFTGHSLVAKVMPNVAGISIDDLIVVDTATNKISI